jgi:hypothetical protein
MRPCSPSSDTSRKVTSGLRNERISVQVTGTVPDNSPTTYASDQIAPVLVSRLR